MFSGQKIVARYTFYANRHFLCDQLFQLFRRLTRVVARLLHSVLCVTTRIFQFLRRLQEVYHGQSEKVQRELA
jgi:hypothetical protein